MPTYDYQCQKCDHRFEQFQSMAAKPLRKCPECGKASLERLIGAGAGVIFKGSGFYQTDYRTESYKQGEKSDGSGSCAPTCGTDQAPAGCTQTKATAAAKTGSDKAGSGKSQAKESKDTSKKSG